MGLHTHHTFLDDGSTAHPDTTTDTGAPARPAGPAADATGPGAPGTARPPVPAPLPLRSKCSVTHDGPTVSPSL
ncbi:hypothetical protein A3L22_01800 [Streptomyces griseus subsp. griseus]|nr:hypothetical protein A3L22_01800 [Streptomyces griseus subsp. griseus]